MDDGRVKSVGCVELNAGVGVTVTKVSESGWIVQGDTRSVPIRMPPHASTMGVGTRLTFPAGQTVSTERVLTAGAGLTFSEAPKTLDQRLARVASDLYRRVIDELGAIRALCEIVHERMDADELVTPRKLADGKLPLSTRLRAWAMWLDVGYFDEAGCMAMMREALFGRKSAVEKLEEVERRRTYEPGSELKQPPTMIGKVMRIARLVHDGTMAEDVAAAALRNVLHDHAPVQQPTERREIRCGTCCRVFCIARVQADVEIEPECTGCKMEGRQ